MTTRPLCLLALLSAALVAPAATFAQTSFSELSQRTPANQAEWVELMETNVRRQMGSLTRRIEASATGAGSVSVKITITPRGRVTNVAIRQSSGDADLDAAILRGLRNLRPMPAFTADMPDRDMSLALPIRYNV